MNLQNKKNEIDELLELKIDLLGRNDDIDEAILLYLSNAPKKIHSGVLKCYFLHRIGTISENRFYNRLKHLVIAGYIKKIEQDGEVYYKYLTGAKKR